jgi:hypothetical protein
MFRFTGLLLAALFIAASAPASAVSTTAVPCVTAHWSDLGAGPMTVQASSPACLVEIADADPGTSQVGFHLTAAEPFAYAGTSHLWVFGSGYAVIGK